MDAPLWAGSALTLPWTRSVPLLVFNVIAFYLCWFACVVGAAQGVPWAGPLAVALFLALQWSLGGLTPHQRRVVLASMVIGFGLDSALAAWGWYRFLTNPPGVWWSPAWMVALWANFALALPVALAWLRRRLLLSALLGAVAGPISYLAGERLGAIVLSPGALWVLALMWALVLPFLVWLTHLRQELDQ